jgi:hypothetical protein
MNSEQFSSALDGISDDLIDAAAGAYERKNDKKKWFVRGLCVACIGLLLVVVGLIRNLPAGTADPSQPTIALQNPTTTPTTHPETTEPTKQDIIVHTGNVYFLTATEEGTELAPLQANMTLPWDHVFYVRSLKGLTEEEVREVMEEERQKVGDFREKYEGLIGEGRYETYYLKDAVVRYYSAGMASLILLNNSQIERVDREATGVLRVGSKNLALQEDYTFGKDGYAVTVPGGSLRIYLDCGMTEETRKIFEENPETPLSTISETITLTIHYKNGTKEIVVIDVTVDDDGYIYMTQRGDSIGA